MSVSEQTGGWGEEGQQGRQHCQCLTDPRASVGASARNHQLQYSSTTPREAGRQVHRQAPKAGRQARLHVSGVMRPSQPYRKGDHAAKQQERGHSHVSSVMQPSQPYSPMLKLRIGGVKLRSMKNTAGCLFRRVHNERREAMGGGSGRWGHAAHARSMKPPRTQQTPECRKQGKPLRHPKHYTLKFYSNYRTGDGDPGGVGVQAVVVHLGQAVHMAVPRPEHRKEDCQQGATRQAPPLRLHAVQGLQELLNPARPMKG